jgi:putative endonuclease
MVPGFSRPTGLSERVKVWYVYILECQDSSLYTGITNNLQRRLQEHQQGKGGCYTRSFGAKRLVYREGHPDRSQALKREAQIKGWPRSRKQALIKGERNG